MPKGALEGGPQGGLFHTFGRHPKIWGNPQGKGEGEENETLDKRLDPRHKVFLARRSGPGKP